MFSRAKSGDEVFIKNGFMIYRVLQKKPITHIVVHVWEKAPLHVFCVHMCILGMHGCMCFLCENICMCSCISTNKLVYFVCDIVYVWGPLHWWLSANFSAKVWENLPICTIWTNMECKPKVPCSLETFNAITWSLLTWW